MTDKNVARDGRLSMRKFNEEVYRKQFRIETHKKCAEPIRLFAECSSAEGFMVLFRCRELNSKMNECLSTYNTEQQFLEYLSQVHSKASSDSTN